MSCDATHPGGLRSLSALAGAVRHSTVMWMTVGKQHHQHNGDYSRHAPHRHAPLLRFARSPAHFAHARAHQPAPATSVAIASGPLRQLVLPSRRTARRSLLAHLLTWLHSPQTHR